MVNRELFGLFNTDSTDKQFRIEFDGGIITNVELHSQSFELTESLCSEKNLRFGCCEASSIKFKISNIFTPLKDKWLTVTITLNKDSTKKMTIGKYKVYSDVPTADKRFRDVVAYDFMHDIINADVSDWYNSLTFPMTLFSFRNSFFSYFGIAQETANLVNDGIEVEETIKPSELSGRDVITAICEINGVFGHIGRDGKFKYIDIAKYVGALYPSDDLFPDRVPDYLSQGKNEHLYPQGDGENSQRVTKCKNYIKCQYEDYIVKDITKLQIREKEGDIGVIWGDGDNSYVVQDNFLVYGKSSSELRQIAERLFQTIRGAIYRPFSGTVKGCPCLEVGDYVQFYTKRAVVSSYILKRTLKGIQALKDDFLADGEMLQPEKVNDIHTSIIQLKGKSNVLERTIEETKSTITDVEKGLQSQIVQTAEEISTSVSKQITETKEYAEEQASAAEKNAKDETTEKLKSYSTTTEVNSAITQKADSITATVDKQITETKEYADGKIEEASASLSSQIEQTAENITLEVSQIYASKSYADNAAQDVKDAIDENLKLYSTTTEMNSKIDQKTDSITSTVSKSIKSWASEDIEYEIDYYGFGNPDEQYEETEELAGKTYLDQETGKLYEYYINPASGIGAWTTVLQLISVESSANSKIAQTEKSIVLSVDDDGNVVAVELTADRSTGTTNFTVGADNISLEGKTINLTSGNIAIQSTNFSVDKNGTVTAKNINITGGAITWDDIDTSGLNIPTSNDISSISKTTITKDYIETLQIKAGSVDAENIAGTTISGKTISGGTVNGAAIEASSFSCYNTLYMQYDKDSKKIPVLIMGSATEPATLQIGKSVASLQDLTVHPNTAFENVVRVSKNFYANEAIYGKNIHADGGHFYATASYEGATDTAEHGILELEKSNNTESCCVGYSGLPLVLRGSAVYLKGAGGTVVSSDERLKNSFKSLEEFKGVYMDLEPCAFKYNNGTSDRYHFGLRAQNVEKALLSHGYTTKDFAGFVQMQDSEDSDDYCGIKNPKALVYTEFIPWNMHMIQNHEIKIKTLERKVEEQAQEISGLQSKLNDLERKFEMFTWRF